MLCRTAQNAHRRAAIVQPMPEMRLGLPTVALVFIAVWVLGSISSVTFGGGLHLLLFAAIGMLAPRLVRGRKGAE